MANLDARTRGARREIGGARDIERPLTSVDVVIFSLREERFEVLLVQRPSAEDAPAEPYPGRWALPGGFIDVALDADLESCARRKLREKTGVEAPYLEQLGSFGNATRDPRGWSATHAYFALLPSASLGRMEPLRSGGNAADTRWFEIEHAPRYGVRGLAAPLAFDHTDILAAAVARLRAKVEYTSLPAFLLPGEFTLSELQRVFETVLGRVLEKKAFRTRMLGSGVLEALPRTRGGANRPAQLFRLSPTAVRRGEAHIFARPFSGAGGANAS